MSGEQQLDSGVRVLLRSPRLNGCIQAMDQGQLCNKLLHDIGWWEAKEAADDNIDVMEVYSTRRVCWKT